MDQPNTSPAQDESQQDVAPPAAAADVAVDPAYGESWFTATGDTPQPRLPLTHDLDVDVCIIGGGLAGLTTALEMARHGWSVAVLEARRICWNASSRNIGCVRPGYAQTLQNIISRVGPDDARELWLLSQAGVDAVRRSIGESKKEGLLQSEGWLQVCKRDRARDIADEADLLRSYGADIEMWPKDLVRTKVKSPYYFQAIHFPNAFSIHTLDYALDLARRAEAAGARIFEETAALSIDPAGVRKRITTAHGRVRAAHIVLAGNVHLQPIVQKVAHTLIPLQTFAMVTKPLGEALAAAIDYPGAVSDSAFADHQYRIVGGDRLLFAGRVATPQANPRRHGARLRADLRARFPQLGAIDIEHAWGGTIGITVHMMPQIGEVAPGVWLASGFGGQGLNTSAMAASLISGAIMDGDDRYRLFEPFELIWSGGRLGGTVARKFHAAYRRFEEWESRRSRKHELWWIANEPRLKKEAEEAAERARIRAEEAAIAEAERIRRRKIEAEQAEIRRVERERIAAEKAEARRIRAEQKATTKAEAARLKEEQRAAVRAEKERVAAEEAEAARVVEEKRAAERAEAERAAAERPRSESPAPEQTDAERLEVAYRNAERVAEYAARLAAVRPGNEAGSASAEPEAKPEQK